MCESLYFSFIMSECRFRIWYDLIVGQNLVPVYSYLFLLVSQWLKNCSKQCYGIFLLYERIANVEGIMDISTHVYQTCEHEWGYTNTVSTYEMHDYNL